MNTSIADERILLFTDELAEAEARSIADRKKSEAFGTLNKVASFLSKPKEDDFVLIYSEHRYEPFWNISGHATYVYDRKNIYHWPVSGAEVQELTVLDKKFAVEQGSIKVEAVDHCVQEEHISIFVDGLSGEKRPHLEKYLQFSAKETDQKELEQLTHKKMIFIPPVARASAIVREGMTQLMKVIQADEIFEETVAMNHVDLYYHPVFAFRYQWLSKGKEAVVEVDGLTGEVSFGHKTFQEFLGKALDQQFLFDVGADAAGMFIPGGSIAVKIAKKYIDHKKK